MLVRYVRLFADRGCRLGQFAFSFKANGEVSTRIPERDAVKTTLNEIVDILQNRGHTVLLPSDFADRSSVRVLLRYGMPRSYVVSLLTTQLEFFKTPGDQLEPVLRAFTSYGVPGGTAVLVITGQPKLLQEKEEHVVDHLQALRHILPKDNSRSLSRLLEETPEVMFMDVVEEMRNTKHELGNFFKAKEIAHMLANYPSILTYDFEKLERLYEYIYFVLGLEPEQIVHSHWYKHSLEKIRLRYWFASKSGTYTQPCPKKPARSEHNPSLRQLLDSDDKAFAHICRCNVDELVVFQKMHAKEFEDPRQAQREIADRRRLHFDERPAPSESGGQSKTEFEPLMSESLRDELENDEEDWDEQDGTGATVNQDKPSTYCTTWNPSRRKRK